MISLSLAARRLQRSMLDLVHSLRGLFLSKTELSTVLAAQNALMAERSSPS